MKTSEDAKKRMFFWNRGEGRRSARAPGASRSEHWQTEIMPEVLEVAGGGVNRMRRHAICAACPLEPPGALALRWEGRLEIAAMRFEALGLDFQIPGDAGHPG